MALAMVIFPWYADKVLITLANAQSVVALLLVIVALKEAPDAKYGRVPLQVFADLFIIVVCGLSGPFIIFVLPFLANRWWSDRRWPNAAVALAAGLISSVQLFCVVSTQLATPSSAASVQSVALCVAMLVYRTSTALFLGLGTAIAMDGWPMWAFVTAHAAAACLYAASLIVLVRRSKNSRLIGTCLGVHVVLLLAVIYKAGAAPQLIGGLGGSERYFYIPLVVFVWAIIGLLPARDIRVKHFAIAALLITTLGSASAGVPGPAFVDYDWESYAKRIGVGDVVVPINPPGWSVQVPARPPGR
jgi:hypothetical protein